jgi:hypothetical protein
MPAVGLLQYGNYIFPENFTHTVNTRPWYGTDQRSVKGTECVLTVEFIVYDKTNLEGNYPSLEVELETIRKQLGTPRLNLIIKATGWANSGNSLVTGQPDVILGANGGAVGSLASPGAMVSGDLNNGPLPQGLVISPIAGINAAKCSWTCSFWYTSCVTGRANAGSLLEYSYTSAFEVSTTGRTKITYAGVYSFSGSNITQTVSTIANRNQLHIQPYIPPGFELLSQSHYINETGEQVSFRFDIQEIASENPYFPFTVNLNGRHQAKSSFFQKDAMSGAGFVTWDNKLDMTVTLAPSVHPRYAYEVFLWVLMQRSKLYFTPVSGASSQPQLSTAKAYDFPSSITFPAATVNVPRVILKDILITEGLYANTHSFTTSWCSICTLNDLLFRSGLFKYVTNNSDKPWNKTTPPAFSSYQYDSSVKDAVNAQHYRTRTNGGSKTANVYFIEKPFGNATKPSKLFFDPCTGPTEAYLNGFIAPSEGGGTGEEYVWINSTQRVDPNYLYSTNQQTQLGVLDALSISALQSNPEKTFLNYEVEFIVDENSRAYQIPINAADALNQDNFLRGKIHLYEDAYTVGGVPIPLTSTQGQMIPPTSVAGLPNGSVTITSGANTYTVTMIGSATRVGFPVTMPAIIQLGNFPAVRAPGAMFSQTKTYSGGVPIYKADWKVTYLIVGQLTDPHNALYTNPATNNAVQDVHITN